MNRKVLLLTLILSVFWGMSSLFAKPASDKSQTQDKSIKASPQKIMMLKSAASDLTNTILSGATSSMTNTKNGLTANTKSKSKAVSISSKFNGRTIYGNMIYTNEWADMSITDVPYGFYSFNIDNSDSPTFTPLLTNMSYNCYAGTYGAGKFYSIRPISLLGVLTSVSYSTFTTNPWALEKGVMLGSDDNYATYDMIASVMAYDVTSNQVYALEYNEDLTGLYWTTFNKETYSFDIISRWKGGFSALALIATPDGNMYCIGAGGDFYSINKETGIPSLIGNTGVTPLLYAQSATYDSKTGTILWSAVTSNGSDLYSIDISSGVASYIRSFPENNQIVGMYILDNDAVDDAPAKINDLKIEYAQAGGLGTTISFSAPSKTYSGQALTGNVNLKLFVDGEVIRDEYVAPGTTYSIPYNFTNDNHYVMACAVNTAGISPYESTYFYSGYDIPKAVQNLSYSIEDGISKIDWNAPAGGVNDGYVNPDSLFYKVHRFPGKVLVADNLKETNFSETTPTEMQNYFYSVTAYNGKNKASVADSTNSINYGTSFSVPYVQTFDGTNPLEFFTIFDGNNDKQKWTLNSYSKWVSVNTIAGKKVSSDWLNTPRVRLSTGVKYKLTFAVKGFSTYPENLKVLLGTNPLDTTTFATTLKDMPNMVMPNFTDQNVEFSVAEAGDYAVGFYAYSDYTKSSMIAINKIIIEVIGSIGAPDSVSDLTVTRNTNDELAATIAFTTPSKDLDNENLESITKVNIFRGEATEPVYTFDSPATNTQLSWTDTNVPKVGVTTYRVVAENENGIGKYSAASDFIGIYTAPYLETFDTKEARDLYTSEINLTGANDWVYNATKKAINYYNFCLTTGDFHLYTPAIKLEADGVYQLSFKHTTTGYGSATFYTSKGLSPKAAEQTEIAQISAANAYNFTSNSQEFTIEEAGKYYIGINIKANAKYDYIDFNVDSISVKKIKSSRTPNAVDGLTVTPDKSGKLTSTITFKAPATDYAGRELTSISKIEIFRGSGSIPLKSFINPTPGEELTWADQESLQGDNVYLILPSNEFGSGKAVLDTVFVGKDIPNKVTNLMIKADASNQRPTLTWTAPTTGVNGGVLDTESLYYNVLEYNATSKEFASIATNIKDCNYTVELGAKEIQDVFYYGVVPVTNEGQGGIILSYITLGPLFQLPFKESFADGISATEPGINSVNVEYAYWTPTAPIISTVNPQDEDGGMVVFYNQAYSSSLVTGNLISPKIATAGNRAKLSFWLYQGLTPVFATVPYVSVSVSTNDGDFAQVMDTIYTNEGTTGWTEHTVDINNLNGSSFVQFSFNSATSGYLDIVYIDNISLVSNTETGVETDFDPAATVYSVSKGILVKGAYGQKVSIYNASGQRVAAFTGSGNDRKTLSPGIYLVKVNDKVFKTIVK